MGTWSPGRLKATPQQVTDDGPLWDLRVLIYHMGQLQSTARAFFYLKTLCFYYSDMFNVCFLSIKLNSNDLRNLMTKKEDYFLLVKNTCSVDFDSLNYDLFLKSHVIKD